MRLQALKLHQALRSRAIALHFAVVHMSGKRLRDDDCSAPAACDCSWSTSRLRSLDLLLSAVREQVLSNEHRKANPVEAIIAYLSRNSQELLSEFFPSWPCMSVDCAAVGYAHCPHAASASTEIDPPVCVAAGTPWTLSRNDLCPPIKLPDTWEYPSGDAEDHRNGLAERIGYPILCNVKDGMRNEHCVKTGCDHAFAPRNANWFDTTTTPQDEWAIVVEGRDAPEHQMSGGRRRISIAELKQLPVVTKAGLREEEIIGIALYTGPMYEIYNCILNQQSHPASLWNTFRLNRFPTTLSAIVSAIQKLSAATPLNVNEKLYRGNGGSQYLPRRFIERDDVNVRGMAPYGFQSFTTCIDEALKYAKPNDRAQLPMVFVIEPSADPLTGFADVSEFSQYPHECERLLPPLAFLHPDGTRKSYTYRSVEFVPMRVTASHAPSLDELEGKKKKIHITEFENRVVELREALQSKARKRKAADRLQTPNEQSQRQYWQGKEHSVDSLIESIVQKVEEVLQRHKLIDHMDFNKKRYAAIVQEALDCLRMAPSLLNVWLMDETQFIHHVSNYTLLHGHRQYVAFLKKQYQNNPDNRQKRARKLCKHLALLSDANDRSHGETPLMEAAALGGNEEALEFLVSAGEDVHASKANGECSLHLAADNGHEHCIRALVRLGAFIDQPYTSGGSNGRTALHRACINAHSHCVTTLVNLKADINKRCALGRTPLCDAAERGHVGCIEELARHGADLNRGDHTPLYLACQFGHQLSVAALLTHGAKVHLDSELFSPLWIASKNGHHCCVKEFKRVSSHFSLFPSVANPLIVAISHQKSSCVEVLLDLQPPEGHIFTALLAAIWFADSASMSTILCAGARNGMDLLQVRDEDGMTAEQFADACDSDERVLVLLRSASGTLAHVSEPHASAQEQNHWKVLGPSNSLCVTCFDTLRFYSYVTACASYGCSGRDCAYYEITLRYAGTTPQFGLCSDRFVARFRGSDVVMKRTLSIEAKGVGDTDDSWAVDGTRRAKWHGESNQHWGVRWRQGDVIGVACNMRTREMIVSLNGDYSPPNGVVFELPRAARVMYPALFTSVEGHVRANLGHAPFKYAPPDKNYVPFSALPCEDEE